MQTVPFSYEALNAHDALCPQSFIHIHNTGTARFFKRYLLQDALSVFKWTLPDNWDSDYFRYVMMGFGRCVVFRTNLFGVIPQYAELSGYNVFYRPTRAIVANPLLKSRTLTLWEDCTLIKLMPDYGSIVDLIDYYGDLMALTYESLAINILNSRLAYLIGVQSRPEAETFKAIYDEIASGKPAVIFRGKDKPGTGYAKGQPTADQWQTLVQNLKNTFIANDLLDALNSIRDEYLTHIGIPNLSERKKERVNVVDSERNSVETEAKVNLWLEELREGIEKTVTMFPEVAGLNVELRFPADNEGGVADGSNERDRAL